MIKKNIYTISVLLCIYCIFNTSCMCVISSSLSFKGIDTTYTKLQEDSRDNEKVYFSLHREIKQYWLPPFINLFFWNREKGDYYLSIYGSKRFFNEINSKNIPPFSFSIFADEKQILGINNEKDKNMFIDTVFHLIKSKPIISKDSLIKYKNSNLSLKIYYQKHSGINKYSELQIQLLKEEIKRKLSCGL